MLSGRLQVPEWEVCVVFLDVDIYTFLRLHGKDTVRPMTRDKEHSDVHLVLTRVQKIQTCIFLGK